MISIWTRPTQSVRSMTCECKFRRSESNQTLRSVYTEWNRKWHRQYMDPKEIPFVLTYSKSQRIFSFSLSVNGPLHNIHQVTLHRVWHRHHGFVWRDQLFSFVQTQSNRINPTSLHISLFTLRSQKNRGNTDNLGSTVLNWQNFRISTGFRSKFPDIFYYFWGNFHELKSATKMYLLQHPSFWSA